jgi:hypothetical protein
MGRYGGEINPLVPLLARVCSYLNVGAFIVKGRPGPQLNIHPARRSKWRLDASVKFLLVREDAKTNLQKKPPATMWQ